MSLAAAGITAAGVPPTSVGGPRLEPARLPSTCAQRQQQRHCHRQRRRASQTCRAVATPESPAAAGAAGLGGWPPPSPPAPTASVTFTVPQHVEFGHELRLVGSTPEMGSWDCYIAPAMMWSEGDNWVLTLEVPAGMHEFKLVVKKSDTWFDWEDGPNRTLEVPPVVANARGALSVMCEGSEVLVQTAAKATLGTMLSAAMAADVDDELTPRGPAADLADPALAAPPEGAVPAPPPAPSQGPLGLNFAAPPAESSVPLGLNFAAAPGPSQGPLGLNFAAPPAPSQGPLGLNFQVPAQPPALSQGPLGLNFQVPAQPPAPSQGPLGLNFQVPAQPPAPSQGPLGLNFAQPPAGAGAPLGLNFQQPPAPTNGPLGLNFPQPPAAPSSGPLGLNFAQVPAPASGPLGLSFGDPPAPPAPPAARQGPLGLSFGAPAPPAQGPTGRVLAQPPSPSSGPIGSSFGVPSPPPEPATPTRFAASPSAGAPGIPAAMPMPPGFAGQAGSSFAAAIMAIRAAATAKQPPPDARAGPVGSSFSVPADAASKASAAATPAAPSTAASASSAAATRGAPATSPAAPTSAAPSMSAGAPPTAQAAAAGPSQQAAGTPASGNQAQAPGATSTAAAAAPLAPGAAAAPPPLRGAAQAAPASTTTSVQRKAPRRAASPRRASSPRRKGEVVMECNGGRIIIEQPVFRDGAPVGPVEEEEEQEVEVAEEEQQVEEEEAAATAAAVEEGGQQEMAAAEAPRSASAPQAAVPAAAAAAAVPQPPAAPSSSSSSNADAHVAVAELAPATKEGPVLSATEIEYLTGRAKLVQQHFATAMGADDFMQRLELALFAFGFNGSNSIAMVNLCRDEVTVSLKHRIEQVFGSSFATNGLGGVLTCGATGMGAGFSHSPVGSGGKERYVFFSFPHISINSRGDTGLMSRPGRPGQSCACGALLQATDDIRTRGLTCNCKPPGVHDALDPEMSILKQRLARRLRHEGATDETVKSLTLVDMTKVAERTISDDLEFLISQTVDAAKADYAVVTGIQVHNWSYDFEDESPNLEFVAPTSVYVVVNGQKTYLDIGALPPLTPRQMQRVAGEAEVCNQAGQTVLREEEAPYAFDSKEMRKSMRERLERYAELIKEQRQKPSPAAASAVQVVVEAEQEQQQSEDAGEGKAASEIGEEDGMVEAAPPVSPAAAAATWVSRIVQDDVPQMGNSTVIDHQFSQDSALQEIREQLIMKYKQKLQS